MLRHFEALAVRLGAPFMLLMISVPMGIPMIGLFAARHWAAMGLAVLWGASFACTLVSAVLVWWMEPSAPKASDWRGPSKALFRIGSGLFLLYCALFILLRLSQLMSPSV